MRLLHPNAEATARKYIGVSSTLEPLGWGVGGAVFKSPVSFTAIKAHLHEHNFDREVAAYRRLGELGIFEIDGLAIPRLVNSNRSVRIIEMSTVAKPYLLDFANARLDVEPDFSEDAMQVWWQTLAERFDDQFPRVQSIYYELANRCGLYYLDFKPGNVEFGFAGT